LHFGESPAKLAGLFAFGVQPMTYTIYGDRRTGAFSSEAALAEAGAEYVFERIRFRDHAQRTPEFRAINPSGKVPALRLPDGTILTESIAILLAIAERFPAAALLPPIASWPRAQAYRWLAFMAGEIYPMVEIADYPDRFVPAGEQAEALREKVRARVRENLLLVEATCVGPWLLGEAFSLVDIYIAMFTRWTDDIGKEWLAEGHLPKLLALAERLSKRERIAPVWARHFGKD
jgi:GST-like protein